MENLSQKTIYNIISKNSFNIKKNFGQNFLFDENVLQTIIDIANVNKKDKILEIGPGLGFLTDYLLKNSEKVYAIEIDSDLYHILLKKYEKTANLRLIQGDFLKITNDLNCKNLFFDENDNNNHLKCVANLPYYITSPILMRLLELDFIDDITVMVQKEVGERIFAKPSTKDYGILTLAINFYSEPIDKFFVSKNSFYPKPNVDSMVLRLAKNDVYKTNLQKTINAGITTEYLFKIIKASFSQRRKVLPNSISSTTKIDKNIIIDTLKKLNINENVRAENLTLDDFINIGSSLFTQTNNSTSNK